MNATPPVDAPPAPPSNATDATYAKKAAEARGTSKTNEKLTAVGAIAQAIGTEVQKVIIGKAHVIDNVLAVSYTHLRCRRLE